MLPLDALPAPSNAPPIALLSGVRIIDLTTSIAGPYAAMLLADMGAEVVKVERPGAGDDSRAWGPPFLDGESLWFLSVNRNKSSVTLDYSGDAGRHVLHDLVRKADLVIVNLVERVQRKLGVDYGSLSAVRPDLVYVSLTGFGLKGTRKDFPCYDLIAEGYSSVMDLTGEAESPPQKVGTPAADLIAGMDAAYAALAALFDRSRTGRGHHIDISMIDSMTRFMAPRIVPYLGSGEVPKRSGARDSVIAVYQTFDTRDDPITLGLGNDAIWQRFWEAAGRPELGRDPRYAKNAGRRAARAEIVAEIQKVLSTRGRDEWLRIFVEAKVPAGPVNRVDQVAGDPELVSRGLFYTDRSNGRTIPQVGLGIGVDGTSSSYRLPPPRLGEHTDSVLRGWLEYDEARIAQLRRDKVV
ncbi:MAG TPA: CoA transferase [Burkholderiales bacterium]|nr:CoA transferase [Burkholderiales bacterium]